jgi:hypothetical protein
VSLSFDPNDPEECTFAKQAVAVPAWASSVGRDAKSSKIREIIGDKGGSCVSDDLTPLGLEQHAWNMVKAG